MKLTFRSRHRSIRELPATELPSFVLLTGVNGAGKTHLLTAIQHGAIAVDAAPTPQTDIRYFDWGSLMPNDAAQMSSPQLYQERDQILQQVAQGRMQFEPQMSQILGSPALRNWRFDGWNLAELSEAEFFREFGDSPTTRDLRRQLTGLIDLASNQIFQQLGGNNNPVSPPALRLKAVAAERKTQPALLAFRHFSGKHIGWGSVDLFQQSFAQLFLAYFEHQRLNRLYQMDKAEGREPGETPLSEEQFVDRHGRPPWDFVNRTLELAGLDFEIDHPKDWAQTLYTPKLIKRSSGVPVLFSSLSSGEKILMSFALCLYNSTDKRQSLARPKLLLLDEVDAPLHPSMSRRLMDTITRTLVEQEKINVIMTTHSPSTVAVAPEESVYVMDGKSPSVRKSSKAGAVSILTSEIPMLSISFDGRRQVFVESDTDTKLYGLLYQHLRPSLSSERSLTFIGAGVRGPDGDKNAGCAQVRKVVEHLENGGNSTVFGLLDWDKKNSPYGRIHVLAAGERYAIENCLLDPLLLAVTSIRKQRTFGEFVNADETFIQLLAFPVERLQEVAEKVELRVLELSRLPDLGPLRLVQYVGGFSLKISERYLHQNGHDLEKAAKKTLPHLNAFRNNGALLQHVVTDIVAEAPKFIPSVLKDCFTGLLDA